MNNNYVAPKLIAHRGNLDGSNEQENDPKYIKKALDAGFDVEIDIWFIDNKYYSGHDRAKYIIEYELLITPKIWVHCKNIDALIKLSADERVHCFYHNNDSYTLTSQNIIWAYPNQPISTLSNNRTVAVMYSNTKELIENRIALYGICCDNPLELRQLFAKLQINNLITQNVRIRPDWHNVFMHIAHTVAARSTCLRIQTGALLVKDSRIISMGYNGSVPGSVHCNEYWQKEFEEKKLENEYITMDEFIASNEFYKNHHQWSTGNEIHGEQNAILYAARNAISTQGSVMYTVYSPCINCAKVLITAGITKCYFSRHYKRDQTGSDFLVRNGVTCQQIS